MRAKRTGQHVVRYGERRQYYKCVLDEDLDLQLVRVSKRRFERSGEAERYHWRFWAKLRKMFTGRSMMDVSVLRYMVEALLGQQGGLQRMQRKAIYERRSKH